MFCICELANNQRKFSVSGTDNNVCLVFLRHPVIKTSTAVSEAVNSEILGVFLCWPVRVLFLCRQTVIRLYWCFRGRDNVFHFWAGTSHRNCLLCSRDDPSRDWILCSWAHHLRDYPQILWLYCGFLWSSPAICQAIDGNSLLWLATWQATRVFFLSLLSSFSVQSMWWSPLASINVTQGPNFKPH